MLCHFTKNGAGGGDICNASNNIDNFFKKSNTYISINLLLLLTNNFCFAIPFEKYRTLNWMLTNMLGTNYMLVFSTSSTTLCI